MPFKVGDVVRISNRLLTINYNNLGVDPPTQSMIDRIGKCGVVINTRGREYELDIMIGIMWYAEELDYGAVNKGKFTNVEEV